MWQYDHEEEESARKGEIRHCARAEELVELIHGATRLELIGRLAHSGATVSSFATAMKVDNGDVSYHLGKLWKAGLVRVEKVGSNHVYHLTNLLGTTLRGTVLELTCAASNGDRLSLVYHLEYLEKIAKAPEARSKQRPA